VLYFLCFIENLQKNGKQKSKAFVVASTQKKTLISAKKKLTAVPTSKNKTYNLPKRLNRFIFEKKVPPSLK